MRRDAPSPLTAERLRDLLRYQPSTGLWKALRERSNNGRTIYGWHRGTPCEPRNRKGEGRRQIMVDGKRYLAHRLAVLWMTGHWPRGNVRHRDGNRSNNRWNNLLDLGAVVLPVDDEPRVSRGEDGKAPRPAPTPMLLAAHEVDRAQPEQPATEPEN